MKRTLTIAAFLFLAPLLPAADIKGPDRVAQYKLVKLTADVPAGSALKWDIFPRGVADADKTVKGQLIFTAPPGSYEVTLSVFSLKDGQLDFTESTKTVVIDGTTPPTPPGPSPPNPPNPPTPPGPGPVANLHVLILYESADKTKYKPETVAILQGKAMADFLDTKTPVRPDNYHAWRVWDHNLNTANEDAVWKTLSARPHTSTPWIILAGPDGAPAYEGPLPPTVDETKALINKYTAAALKKAG